MTKLADIPYPNPRRPLSVWHFIRHLPSTVRLFGRLFRDARVGLLPKVILVAALFYLALPFDFLADWLPLIGIVDDLALLLLAARLFVGLCPRPVIDEHLQRMSAS